MTSQVQRKRAGKLANILEALPDDSQFDMSRWIRGRADNEGNVCGTSACACGWALQSGQFGYGYGVKNHRLGKWARTLQAVKNAFSLGEYNVTLKAVNLKTKASMSVEEFGRRVFGDNVFDNIFMYTSLNRQEVIDRLRLVADGGWA